MPKDNSLVPKTSIPIPNPTNEITPSSLISSFRAFDIIDHAKKTNMQILEAKYLKANPDQFDFFFNFVKDKVTHPSRDSSQDIPVVPKPRLSQINFV